jgi:hypothetical protein
MTFVLAMTLLPSPETSRATPAGSDIVVTD